MHADGSGLGDDLDVVSQVRLDLLRHDRNVGGVVVPHADVGDDEASRLPRDVDDVGAWAYDAPRGLNKS